MRAGAVLEFVAAGWIPVLGYSPARFRAYEVNVKRRGLSSPTEKVLSSFKLEVLLLGWLPGLDYAADGDSDEDGVPAPKNRAEATFLIREARWAERKTRRIVERSERRGGP